MFDLEAVFPGTSDATLRMVDAVRALDAYVPSGRPAMLPATDLRPLIDEAKDAIEAFVGALIEAEPVEGVEVPEGGVGVIEDGAARVGTEDERPSGEPVALDNAPGPVDGVA